MTFLLFSDFKIKIITFPARSNSLCASIYFMLYMALVISKVER